MLHFPDVQSYNYQTSTLRCTKVDFYKSKEVYEIDAFWVLFCFVFCKSPMFFLKMLAQCKQSYYDVIKVFALHMCFKRAL